MSLIKYIYASLKNIEELDLEGFTSNFVDSLLDRFPMMQLFESITNLMLDRINNWYGWYKVDNDFDFDLYKSKLYDTIMGYLQLQAIINPDFINNFIKLAICRRISFSETETYDYKQILERKHDFDIIYDEFDRLKTYIDKYSSFSKKLKFEDYKSFFPDDSDTFANTPELLSMLNTLGKDARYFNYLPNTEEVIGIVNDLLSTVEPNIREKYMNGFKKIIKEYL